MKLLVPVKRVDLILRAVAAAARQRPSIEFEWHHFGEGALLQKVEATRHFTEPPSSDFNSILLSHIGLQSAAVYLQIRVTGKLNHYRYTGRPEKHYQ